MTLNRRHLLASAGALTATPALAQPTAWTLMPPIHPEMSGRFPGDVPMIFWRAMPAVRAMVGGHGPFTFGIDTGFPGLMAVSQEVVAAAGLTPFGQMPAADPSGANPVAVPVYQAPSLTLGDMTFRQLIAGGLPLRLPPGSEPLHGILGMGLFAPHTLDLDFAGRRVGLSDEALPPPGEGGVTGFAPGGLIEVEVRVGDVPLRAHLDTGQSRMGLMVPQAAVAGLPTRGEPRRVGQARTVSQTIDLFAVDLAAPVRFGGLVLPITEAGYPTPVPLANLGGAAFRDARLTLDLGRGRLRVLAGQPRS